MRTRFTLVVLVVLAALGGAPAAVAHDHEPPMPTLHAAGRSQEPGFVEIQWVWATGPDTCIQANFIGTGTFGDRGRGITVPFGTSHAEIHVRNLVNPPSHVELYSWRRLDRRGAPAGERQDHTVALTPRVVRGEVVGWAIGFAPHRRGRGFYQLFAVWPDAEGCGGDQFGIWRYRLDAASP